MHTEAQKEHEVEARKNNQVPALEDETRKIKAQLEQTRVAAGVFTGLSILKAQRK